MVPPGNLRQSYALQREPAYAGLSSIELVDRHAEFGDRLYRLWGLLVDRRFEVGRWAPLLLAAVPGLVLLAFGNGECRLLLGLIVLQLLIATFLAITMMGWWFAGRTLLVVLPLLTIPLVRWVMTALAVYSVAITAGLADAGHTREVTIVVDPFDMAFPPLAPYLVHSLNIPLGSRRHGC